LQTKDVSLPVHREFVAVKLSYARLLLSMLRLHISDERQKLVLKLQKPAVLQVTHFISLTAEAVLFNFRSRMMIRRKINNVKVCTGSVSSRG